MYHVYIYLEFPVTSPYYVNRYLARSQKQTSPGSEEPRHWQYGNTRCSENRSRCIIKRRVRLPFGQHFGRGGGGRGGSGCLPWISGSAQWKGFRWFHVMCSVNDLLVTIIPLILSEASPHLKLEIFGNPYLHLPELYTVQCNLRKGILLKLNMFLVPLWPIQCGATLGLLSYKICCLLFAYCCILFCIVHMSMSYAQNTQNIRQIICTNYAKMMQNKWLRTVCICFPYLFMFLQMFCTFFLHIAA